VKRAFICIILATLIFILAIATGKRGTPDGGVYFAKELKGMGVTESNIVVMGTITRIGTEGIFREYVVLDDEVHIYVPDSVAYERGQQVSIRIKRVSDLFYRKI